ncbi:MAG: sugar ABC transporter ATP-binding protein [Saccharofermentanales bacterium]|jgi:ABC-type sugar transport system ATPase subunit
MQKEVIKTEHLSKEFNGVRVLNDVGFTLRKGEIHALVGENGAGKSTFVKLLSGIYEPTEGQIFIDGKKVNFENVDESEKAGIRTVHQEINLVPYFSVYENVFIGSEFHNKKMGMHVLNDKKMKEETERVLKLLDVECDVTTPVSHLNTTMKKIIEICRVLIFDPKVIIFDEPTAALDESMREHLLEIILGLKRQGISIIYVSHNLEEIIEIADRVTVLRNGNQVGDLSGEDIEIETMIKLMLGDKTYNNYKRKHSYATDKTVLEVKGLNTPKLSDISFVVKEGEILGFAGVEGAGKTEIAKAVFGLDKNIRGEFYLNGQQFNPSTKFALGEGIALVPEERKAEGIIPDFELSANVTLPYLRQWSRFGVIDNKSEIQVAVEAIESLSIRASGTTQRIKFLSGGNQQKVVLAKWLAGHFHVGIFDEPTKGIDIKAKEDIYILMNEIAKEGKSIIMMSSYLPELISICDRIIVLREGRIVDHFKVGEENIDDLEAKICFSMLGGKR